MPSVTQPPATREHLNELIAELYGDPPAPLSTAGERWQQAVAQVDAQLRAKLLFDLRHGLAPGRGGLGTRSLERKFLPN